MVGWERVNESTKSTPNNLKSIQQYLFKVYRDMSQSCTVPVYCARFLFYAKLKTKRNRKQIVLSLHSFVYADAFTNTAGYSSTIRLPGLLHSSYTLDSIACFLRCLVTLQINTMVTVFYTSNTTVLVQVKLIPQIPLETLINTQLQVRQYNYQYNYKQLLASSVYSYCLLPPQRPTAARPSAHSSHPSAVRYTYSH